MKEDRICSKDVGGINFNTGCKNKSSQKSFDIYSFIKDNSQTFTIIGITGTLLALLPNFIEKFIGSDWKQILLSSEFGFIPLISLQIIIISGAFFILLITFQILKHVFDYRKDEEIFHSISISNYTFTYRMGDFNRILFMLFFIPTIGTLIFFISTIFFFQKDITFNFSELIILFIYFILFIFFGYIHFILKREFKSKILKNISVVLILIILICGISQYISLLSSVFTHNTSGHAEIIPQDHIYTALNSSDFGIKLIVGGNVENYSGFDPWYYRFHWTTNYGYFVVSDESSTFYLNEGQELIYDSTSGKFNGYTIKTNDLKIYWAYDFRDLGITKPQTFVLLRIEDSRTNKPITSARINISWLNNDTAIIANSSQLIPIN